MISYETTQSSPIVVNCDATLRPLNDDFASVGIVLQNHNGRVLTFHGRNLGKDFDSTEAECEAIDEALGQCARKPSIQHVTVRSDCKPAVQNTDWEAQYKHDFANVRVEHVPRSDNRVADREADYHADALLKSAGGIESEPTQDVTYKLTD